MTGNTCEVRGTKYVRTFPKDIFKPCGGCVGDDGSVLSVLCSELDDCIVNEVDYVWQTAESAITKPTPYDICMAEHYKYLQYDTVDMDDFERGCIVGRKLQSEKLARLLK